MTPKEIKRMLELAEKFLSENPDSSLLHWLEGYLLPFINIPDKSDETVR